MSQLASFVSDTPRFVRHLLDSYRRWVGVELMERSGDERQDLELLFALPVVVVSHGAEADPIFKFGNQTALNLWELELDAFLKMPSRLTAEPMHRDERARLLARTERDGYVDDYRGVRISSQGRRFYIEQATIWNVVDDAGDYIGQAATFDHWTFLAAGETP
ncbi:MEKHLA domain-containing protein [Blastopirellula sp. JC732]|uniref:MEKHLA domain-containing protein n=1 Tax=Blastopirellula sediminis TaxID=2894196 RepID=A0A9X1SIE2_9BACT|nr:MEKHLA domain-containing protein [Blastopirellula sediminis]MCC9605202.1 MEKHLA domain-containing protein [Blastopirellula sediminis]MCC9631498.1 MEKHLA domain-containing protein [Blastopirellula sediminis]